MVLKNSTLHESFKHFHAFWILLIFLKLAIISLLLPNNAYKAPVTLRYVSLNKSQRHPLKLYTTTS